MNNEEWGDVLRQNWYLGLVLVGAIAIAVFGWLRQGAAPATAVAPVKAEQTQSEPAEVADASTEPQSLLGAPQEKARKTIAAHQAEIDAHPDSPDTPALLFAMGNLYRHKLLDYNEAARCYTLLILDHPTWDGIDQVYIQLATCYDRLNDLENRNRIYEQMVRIFPEDTKEYEFAKAQLAP